MTRDCPFYALSQGVFVFTQRKQLKSMDRTPPSPSPGRRKEKRNRGRKPLPTLSLFFFFFLSFFLGDCLDEEPPYAKS